MPYTTVPFFSQLHIDEEMQRLNRAYNLASTPREPVLSSLGWGEAELLVVKLFGLCRLAETFAGFEESELVAFAKHYNLYASNSFVEQRTFVMPEILQERGFLRRGDVIPGKIVLFPTERLLKNQGAQKYNR